MDTLTFNTPVLYRHLTFSEAKKQPISEINLKAALEGLEMEMPQVSVFDLSSAYDVLSYCFSSLTFVSCSGVTISSLSRALARRLR